MASRKLAVAAMVAVVATGLAGCSTSAPQPSSSSTAEHLSGTLVIGAYSTAKVGLDPLIAKFEKANPDLVVTATYADNQPYQAAIRTQLSAGTGPDLFTVWPGNGNPGAMKVLAPTGYLLDLSKVSGLPTLPSTLDNVTKINGKQYVFPLTVAGIGAVYNEQAVKDANAKIPTTWSEVLDFCSAAKADRKVAFSLGLNTLFVTQLINYALTSTLVYQADPKFDAKLASGKATFDSSNWKKSFQMYMTMEKDGCFTANALGTTNDVAQSDVATGKALATVTLTTTISQIQALAPSGTTFGIFALPATSNGKDTWMPAAAFDGFGINAKAKNPTAAAAFLKFIASPSSMAEYATVAGSLPSIATSSFKITPSLAILDTEWMAGKTYPFPDQLWPNPLVSPAHKVGVQKVFGGQASIDDILKQMDAAYNTN